MSTANALWANKSNINHHFHHLNLIDLWSFVQVQTNALAALEYHKFYPIRLHFLLYLLHVPITTTTTT